MKEINNYCQIGEHHVGDRWVSTCTICNKTCCYEHQGNREATAGSYVGCQYHKAEVDELNRQWLVAWHEKHSGGAL